MLGGITVTIEVCFPMQGLCHIRELSSSYLAKADDVSCDRISYQSLIKLNISYIGVHMQVFKVGDRVDVKLIEVPLFFDLLL